MDLGEGVDVRLLRETFDTRMIAPDPKPEQARMTRVPFHDTNRCYPLLVAAAIRTSWKRAHYGQCA